MPKVVNVVLYGVGHMGKLIARFLDYQGFNIVGAINRTSDIGLDLGQVAGLDRELGVRISDSPDGVYRNNRVDIAIVSTASDMVSFANLAKDILPRGVNVLTITDEAFWPWRFAPELCREIDQLARDHHVTVTAGGLQDTCLLNVISTLTGGCNSIERLSVSTNANLDSYGRAALEHYPIGLTKGEYESAAAEFQEERRLQPIFAVAMEALVANLGLTITRRSIWYTPLFAQEATPSRSLGKTIGEGLTVGHAEHVEFETGEGITIRTEFKEIVSSSRDPSRLTWDIKGVPDIRFTIERLDGEAVTCASIVNRIYDVLGAEAGFKTCESLPAIKIQMPIRTAPVERCAH